MIWQPIETAPPNGEPVLLLEQSRGRWGAFVGVVDAAGWRPHCPDDVESHPYVTHWMPLPPPPEDAP